MKTVFTDNKSGNAAYAAAKKRLEIPTSDTPRTDALLMEVHDSAPFVEFARQLERELSVAQESSAALETIKEMACYALEEDIDSRQQMLLRIVETAVAALAKDPCK